MYGNFCRSGRFCLEVELNHGLGGSATNKAAQSSFNLISSKRNLKTKQAQAELAVEASHKSDCQ